MSVVEENYEKRGTCRCGVGIVIGNGGAVVGPWLLDRFIIITMGMPARTTTADTAPWWSFPRWLSAPVYGYTTYPPVVAPVVAPVYPTVVPSPYYYYGGPGVGFGYRGRGVSIGVGF